eukprot:PhF_6_TR40736/c0_g1_i1/m.61289
MDDFDACENVTVIPSGHPYQVIGLTYNLLWDLAPTSYKFDNLVIRKIAQEFHEQQQPLLQTISTNTQNITRIYAMRNGIFQENVIKLVPSLQAFLLQHLSLLPRTAFGNVHYEMIPCATRTPSRRSITNTKLQMVIPLDVGV